MEKVLTWKTILKGVNRKIFKFIIIFIVVKTALINFYSWQLKREKIRKER